MDLVLSWAEKTWARCRLVVLNRWKGKGDSRRRQADFSVRSAEEKVGRWRWASLVVHVGWIHIAWKLIWRLLRLVQLVENDSVVDRAVD